MQIVSPIDLLLDVEAGQRLSALRMQLRKGLDQALADTIASVDSAAEAYGTSRAGTDIAVQRTALQALIAATTPLTSLGDLISQAESVDRRLRALAPGVIDSYEKMVSMARLPIPEEMIPAAARAQFAAAAGEQVDGARAATTMMRLSRRATPDSAGSVLERLAKLRIWALHTLLLTEIVATQPVAGPLVSGSPADVVSEASAAVQALRDAARTQARAMRKQVMTPDITVMLHTALFNAESWLTNTGIARIAALLGGARFRIDAGAADAESWARSGAQAYDHARTLFALAAGVRRVLVAQAVADSRLLDEFASVATRRVGSAVPDLPRTDVRALPAGVENSTVEVAGIISDAEYVSGGPAPRSVLHIVDGTVTARLLVPFTSVDSFGVRPGTWVMARGELFVAGKDGMPGPVVQVGRIRRQDAAAQSFFDWLIWTGRDLFDLRPGGFDLLAGRIAGDPQTILESSLRRWLD